jgi:hypothetical protein
MFFKNECSIRDHWIVEPVQFTYSSHHKIEVSLRSPNEHEMELGYRRETAVCTAIMEREPSMLILGMFEDLAENRLPVGSKIPEHSPHVTPDGTIRDGWVVPRSWLPQAFQSFTDQVDNELTDYARRSVLVLRWRIGASGPHNPFGGLPKAWSFDGDTWHSLPSDYFAFVSWMGSRRDISEIVIEQVRNLILAGKTEPIGHELFREAYEQARSNPRSALVIGIAAVETGFKDCVSTLVPDADWLVQNLPSPPLNRMLLEYLPQLPVKAKSMTTFRPISRY